MRSGKEAATALEWIDLIVDYDFSVRTNMRMKAFLIAVASLITGYALGVYLPAQDFLIPKRKIEFETDFTIKAGTKASSRYFGTSVEPVDLPIEMTFNRDNFPKLKYSPDTNE